MTAIGDDAIDPAGYDGSKAPEEIETDIAHTRASLSETLDALERKLAPRQLLEKGVDMFRDSMNGEIGKIGETLRDNPIPLALVGVGLGWLLLSGTGAARNPTVRRYTRQVQHTVSDAVESTTDYAGSLAGRVRGMVGGADLAHARPKTGEAASGIGSSARDTAPRTATGVADRLGGTWQTARDYAGSAAGQAGEVGHRALDTASEYAEYAGEQVHRARDRFAQVMEEYPLAVGALAFLTGAIVAATLPSTRVEDEWVGETRDDLWRQAEATGREALDRAQEVASTAAGAASQAAGEAVKEVVEKTKEAVKDEAERQHLMPEAANTYQTGSAGNKPGDTASGSKSGEAPGPSGKA